MPPSDALSEPSPRVDVRELSGHTTIVTLAGEHDLSTRERVAGKLGCARTASTVIVDLTPCSFLDSTIIATLIGARSSSPLARRIELVLPAEGTAAGLALRLARIDVFFPTHATLEGAITSAESVHADV